MEKNKYQKIEEESERIKENTQKRKKEISENLSSLCESLTKFMRFIDRKIETKRKYFWDKKNSTYTPKREYYSRKGILLYTNITDDYKVVKYPDNSDRLTKEYSGKEFYLTRGGSIYEFERDGVAPDDNYINSDVWFKLKYDTPVAISDIVDEFYEDELDIEVTILRNIYNYFEDAVKENPKKKPILGNIMDILKEELEKYERQQREKQDQETLKATFIESK